MPWYSNSFLPVAASVMTCSWFGVPSSCSPPTTVSYARTGVPEPAQTTLRGAWSASVFGLSCHMCGSFCGGLAAGEGGAVAGEGEHDEGDDGVGGGGAEAASDDQAGLGVRALDQAVAHAGGQGGADGVVVAADAGLEVDEAVDAAAAGPADPAVQCLQGGGGSGLGQGEYRAEGFLESPGAVQAGVRGS